MNDIERLARAKGRLTKYCYWCEETVILTEDGYCVQCGTPADNMVSEIMDKVLNYEE